MGVRPPDERAGRVMDLETGFPPGAAAFIRRAVCRDQDAGGRRRAGEPLQVALPRPVDREAFEGEWIVDQFAEHRQRTGGGERFGLPQRIAHAEAHAEMFRENDFHGFSEFSCKRREASDYFV